MPTATEFQQRLLSEAIPDIQAIANEWKHAGLERPVIFLVDCNDASGKEFMKTFVSPEDEYKAKAARDGGMRADSIATVIKAMAIDDADRALSQMGPPGQTLRRATQDGHIITIVVAFGLINPYRVKVANNG